MPFIFYTNYHPFLMFVSRKIFYYFGFSSFCCSIIMWANASQTGEIGLIDKELNGMAFCHGFFCAFPKFIFVPQPQSNKQFLSICLIFILAILSSNRPFFIPNSPISIQMSSHFIIFSIIFFLAISGHINAMRQQAVAVKGVLLCGARPASGVKVKLWDEDDGPDPDDVLDEGFTDGSGSFQLRGSTRELTNIDPVLKVYHDCDDGVMPGQRKVKLRIPSQYITSGGVARRVFDVGVLNLETIFGKEERDLI